MNYLNSLEMKDENKLTLFKKSDIVWGKFITDDTHDRVYHTINSNFKYMTEFLYSKWDRYDIIHPIEDVHDGGYSRIYFLLSYSFGITEDIIKYYLIPTILTSTIVLFYTIDISSFAGLFPTIMLGDIALLFIQPETGKFTFNEKSIHMNILMTIILCVIKLLEVPLYLGQLVWIFGVILINIINLIHNIYVSGTSINKINEIIKTKNIFKIEMLFNSDYSEISTNSGCCFSKEDVDHETR